MYEFSIQFVFKDTFSFDVKYSNSSSLVYIFIWSFSPSSFALQAKIFFREKNQTRCFLLLVTLLVYCRESFSFHANFHDDQRIWPNCESHIIFCYYIARSKKFPQLDRENRFQGWFKPIFFGSFLIKKCMCGSQ